MPLSSQRQRFSIYVSPRNEDFLFYEKVDAQRVQQGIPEYGAPHPDYRKFPNHFFAQAIQADEEGQIYYYYYAAQREYQDDYNFEHRTVDYKGQTYDIVERSYVTLRAEYDEDEPALATAMPLSDEDPFEASDNYVLTDRQQFRIGDAGRRSTKIGDMELDSMFVLEKHTYTKRAPITTVQYDKATGSHIFSTTNLVHRDEVISTVNVDIPPLFYLQPDSLSFYNQPDEVSRYAVYGTGVTVDGGSTVADLIANPDDPFWEVNEETGAHKTVDQVSEEWYFVTSVVNGDANKRRVFVYLTPDKRDYLFYELVDRKSDTALPTPDLAYGEAHADFPDHVFVAAVPNDPTGDFYRYYYAAERTAQNNYNWNHATTDLGGVRYDTVERTYVIPRADYDDGTPVQASAMPVTPADPFENNDNYILLNRRKEELTGELAELDSIFILETRTFVKRTPLTQTSYDDQTGFHEFRTTNLYHKNETPTGGNTTILNIVNDTSNPFWVVDNEQGAHKVVEQLSSDWFAVIDVYNNDASEKRVFLYLTPNQNDFVFYELVDRKDETNEPSPLPAFGASHPDFSNHGFVAAVPADNSGDFYRFYYAKKRFDEDEYNFEHSFLDVGGVRVSVLRRSYVTLRSEYNPASPDVGATMSTDPSGKFAGNYILVERAQRTIEDETLASLYVSEERVYIEVPTTAQQTNNYALQEGGLTLTRTWIVPRDELNTFTKPAVGTSDTTYGTYKFATRQVSQETPPELDSYYGIVQDIYAKKEWVFREDVRYEIGYKVIQRTTLEDTNTGQGTYTTTFDDRGWQRQQTEFELTGFEYPSQTENRPYGKITTNTSAALSPYGGDLNSRSRIVFDDGQTQVYQNDIETFTVKQGGAGTEKRNEAYVSVSINKYYRISGNVGTTSGSSRIIYDDGITQVYEVSEETATGRFGDAGTTKETRPFVAITTNSRYAATGDVTTGTGRSRVVYNDGTTIIYQVDEESSVGIYGDAGETKAQRPFVTITTDSVYSPSGTVTGDTGSSRVVYNDGTTIVYQVDNETAVARTGDAGTTKEVRPFVTITTNSEYATSGNITSPTGSSRVVYNDGSTTVYQVDNEDAAANLKENFSESSEGRVYGKVNTASHYRSSGALAANEIGRSRIVYTDGASVTVYQVDIETFEATDIDAGQSQSAQSWGILITDTSYNTTGEPLNANLNFRSRVVYNDGTTVVYEVNEDTPEVNTEEYVSLEDETDYRKRTVNTKHGTAPEANSDDSKRISNTLVYQDKTNKIYRIDTTTYTARTSVSYETTVTYPFPAVLQGLSQQVWNLRDGTSTTGFAPIWASQDTGRIPCRASITETWTAEPPTEQVSITEITPTPIYMDTPLFKIRIPPCLHGSIRITGTTGTTSAIWEYITWDETFDATTPTTLPNTITIEKSATRVDDGWLSRTVEVYPPS